MKKILVLMATYNGEKYLQEQLDSIFAQKSVDVSILVRDDGSTDGTSQILDSNKSTGKLDWYTGDHLNVAKGYYDLLKKSVFYDAEYLAFSDQDDVWDIDKLECAIDRLNSIDTGILKLYYSGQRLVDSDLKFIANHELNRERSLKTRFVLSDFAGCTGVFSSKLRDKVIDYEPNYILMHDTWILKVCLALGGEVIVDPESHMSYRQHGGNTVGLGRSIPAYLKQVRQYMSEYKVELQMRELINGYGDGIIEPYKEIAEWCCKYRKCHTFKKNLLNKKNIDFHNYGLNVTYKLKVLLNVL